VVLSARWRDDEPPGVASLSRRRLERSKVNADVVCADKGTAESVEFKPKEVDDDDKVGCSVGVKVNNVGHVKNKVVEVFYSGLSEQLVLVTH
jgi:hypothetical protein